MSRIDNLEKLMQADTGKIAPNVTDLTQKEEKTQQSKGKEAEQEKPARAQKKPPENTMRNSPIRLGITVTNNTMTEAALLEIINSVPPSLRSSVNIGRIFKKTMLANDAEIAAMIRAEANK